MKLTRRWLQYSLRSFLVLLTALAVWLGVVVNRAREQREAVKAIEAAGGTVTYDFQITGVPFDGTPDLPHVVERFFDPYAEPPGPLWLRRLIGDDFFQEPVAVNFLAYPRPPTGSAIQKAIRYLKQLRGLKRVAYEADLSDATHRELQAALPASFVTSISIQHTGRRPRSSPK